MMVPVETGAIPKLGTPQPLFNAARSACRTAATTISLPRETDSSSPLPITGDAGHIVVVENWFEELRRRVPTN